MPSLIERFRTYPPLMQWFLAVAAAVGLFLAWQTFIWGAAKSWDAQAEEYRAEIERSRAIDRQVGQRTQAAIITLGETEPLGDEVSGMDALSAAIARVLDQRRVLSRDVKIDPIVNFTTREVPRMIPATHRDKGARISAEVRFEADPQSAFGVIADLESSPAIETVSSVRMSRSPHPGKRTVIVTLTVEAWVIKGLPRNLRPAPAGPATPPSVPRQEESQMHADARGYKKTTEAQRHREE